MTLPLVQDQVLWPLLTALRTSAAGQFGLVHRPVCAFDVYWSDHPIPADQCDCTCEDEVPGGQGAAWVRLVTATSILAANTTARPVRQPCAGADLLLTIEVGVHRCAPLLDGTKPPHQLAVDTYSAGMVQDVLAVHRAFLCAPALRDLDWQLSSLGPSGPQGGCAAVIGTAQVIVSNCCPIVLTVGWVPDPDVLLGVHVTGGGYGRHGALLDWGDGTPPVPIGPTVAPLQHTYAVPGTYQVIVVDRQEPTARTTVAITVKDHEPIAHVFLDSEDDWAVLLWLDEPDDGTVYLVDWGDGSSLQPMAGQQLDRVPPKPRVPHPYTKLGRYPITVTDTRSRRVTHTGAEVGDLGVLPSFDTPARPRLEVLWMATGATYRVDGFITETGVVPASGRIVIDTDEDLPPGQHSVVIREEINGIVRRATRRSYLIPSPWDWRLGVWTTWGPTPGQPGMQTVNLTPRTARTPCAIDWGDGSPIETIPAAGTASHNYRVPITGAGVRLTVTETVTDEITDPRTTSRTLGSPRYVGTPMLNARQTRAVDLDVAGLDHDIDDDRYVVYWGDGTSDSFGAQGRWYPANHRYANDGVYTITVDSPGMAAPVIRTATVISYPAPVVTIVEARNQQGEHLDPDRLTAQVAIDNRAVGGDCRVEFGDGSPAHISGEQDTVTHAYPRAGRYWVVVTALADTTAKGRASVSVPFGQERTLIFTVTGHGYTARVTITGSTPGKTVQVVWTSGTSPQPVPPSGFVEHTYPPIDDIYNVTVSYDDESESVDVAVIIPFPDDTDTAGDGSGGVGSELELRPVGGLTDRQDPYLWWNVGAHDRQLKARWLFGTQQVIIYWGDGAMEVIGVGQAVTHDYDHLGGYLLRLREIGPGAWITAAQVIIRGQRPPAQLTAHPDDPRTLRLQFGDLDASELMPRWRVFWAWPDQHHDDVWAPAGGHVDHPVPAGKYLLHVLDLGSKWFTEIDTEVPPVDPAVTLTATGREVQLSVDPTSAGAELRVDWGDGSLPEPITGDTASHTYPPADTTTFVVQVWHVDESSSASHAITLGEQP